MASELITDKIKGLNTSYEVKTEEIASKKFIDFNVFCSGTNNTLELNFKDGSTELQYINGQRFKFQASNSNTLASTASVSGLAPKDIYKDNSPLTGGEIIQGKEYIIEYNSSSDRFDLVDIVYNFENIDWNGIPTSAPAEPGKVWSNNGVLTLT